MLQDFYTNTIQSRLIKDLIYTTPIPNYNTVRDGDYISKNQIYIYKTRIIKCTKSGFLNPMNTDVVTGNFRTINDFTFGKHYPKFTEKFESSFSYYDYNTHKWLGKLLRCYRDIWDLDLMPFYNCFSGDYTAGLKITNDRILNQENLSYKVLKIPVKFNRQYTIAIDCGSEVTIAPAILSRNTMSNVSIGGKNFELTDMICGFSYDRATADPPQENNIYGNVVKVDSISFKNPITYIVNNTDDETLSDVYYVDTNGNRYHPTIAEFLYNYENQLYMLIQLPIANQSSVVVLEGDYTNTQSIKIYNYEELNKITAENLDEALLGNLSLLQFSDNVSYPFADRLIEYLLWNVICHKDEIGDNVLRVQKKFKWLNSYGKAVPSVWDRSLRNLIFNNYLSNNTNINLDITGYVDKDVEKYMIRKL